MIITEFYKGQGLGNQLACYVTTKTIAEDKGFDFGIMNPERFKGLDFFDLNLGKKVTGGKGPEGGPPKKLPQGIKHYYTEKNKTHPINGADIRIYDKGLINILDNTKIDGLMQGEEYFEHRKEDIKKWLKIKKKYQCYDYSDNNICVINFRGGEYVRHSDLFLNKNYWINAVNHMLRINKNFKFIVITDDIYTAKKFFPNFDVFHFSIGKDYSIIKNAYYLILSNSSFAWFPAWLNEKVQLVIAPKYWGRHNISDGYWSCGYNLTKNWLYQDTFGNLSDYDTCKKEFKIYKEKHKDYYLKLKINKNFLVISNYNNDINWVPEYTNNYIIYNKESDKVAIPKTINSKKVIQSQNLGYNFYDYFTFIIDNYDSLPENIIFVKGNVFPRHITREYFEKIMNNNYFTSIEDWKMHKPKFPIAFFLSDGGYCEKNNSWYLKHFKTKYFTNYNNFLKFIYKESVLPRYIRFAPGGNYIVPKNNILKIPKVVYENLKLFISHSQLAGETHIIERFIHTLWTSDFEFSPKILKPLGKDFSMPKKKFIDLLKEKTPVKIKRFVSFNLVKLRNKLSNIFHEKK